MTGTNKWQNRIVALGEADPADLLANPNNWRIHPKNQQDALKGSLDAVGWVDAAIVNQRTQFVVDGHLRVAMAISEEESSIPVLYVDLDEREEAIVLATFDPITGLAVTDPQMLAGLIDGIEFESPALERVVANILSDTVAADLVDDHEPQEGTSQENALL